jgi:hypothetical protein
MAVKRSFLKDEGGQTGLEWLLLIFVIVGGFVTVTAGMDRYQLASKIARPINTTFKRTYQYGHPKAKGYDDGGPEFHPRATDRGNNNFRIFINPGR